MSPQQSKKSHLPSNTSPPVVSGNAVQGQTLSASTGSWTNSPTRYQYQWRRLVSAVWSPIAGAIASTYLVGAADVGNALDVVVTATNSSGSASATSATTATVTAAPGGGGTPPTPAPISGLGYSLVLDEDFTAFSYNNSGSQDDAFTWQRPWGGANVAGAVAVDANHVLHLYSNAAWGYAPFTLIATKKSVGDLTNSWIYGYFEASIALPAGIGVYPQWWLASTENIWGHDCAVTPYSAQQLNPEIDIVEGGWGSQTGWTGNSEYNSTLHYNTDGVCGTPDQTQSKFFPSDALAGTFHTYGCLWTSTGVTFYLDGVETASWPTYPSMDAPMYALLGSGPHSAYPGALPSTIDTQVQWVRVWQAAPRYPASFFTGPLGSKNIVPSDPTGALFALWFGDSADGAAASRTAIAQRITDMGRTPDLIGCQLDQLTSGTNSETWIHSLPAIPIINWEPPNPGGTTPLASLASGSQDATIASVATRLAASPFRIMLRFFIEFNISSNWYSYAFGSNTTTDFVNAWRHVVGVFQANGASNVGFWFCPQEQANATTRTNINACYPGDTWVDWVGSDGYNHDNNASSSPKGWGWAEFDDIFNYPSGFYGNSAFFNDWAATKPFVVGETGTKFDTLNVPTLSQAAIGPVTHAVDTSRKANWYLNIDSVNHPLTAGKILGIQFFDQWVSAEGNDWHTDHNQAAGTWSGNTFTGTTTEGSLDTTTYSGFLSLAGKSWLNVGAIGGAA